MKRHTLPILACLTLAALTPAAAQDLTITNARIITSTGTVIERGSIVVRGGKIVSVAAGAPAAPAGQVIDAKGMSAMPGYIDGHKHVNGGPNEAVHMQSLLEAGYTTVLIGGGMADNNVALAERVNSGKVNGPRLIPSGAVGTNQTPAEARAAI